MSVRVRLTKVQVAAEFALDDGEALEPGVFTVELTAREWGQFNLQRAIEAGVAEKDEPEESQPKPNRAARRSKAAKS